VATLAASGLVGSVTVAGPLATAVVLAIVVVVVVGAGGLIVTLFGVKELPIALEPSVDGNEHDGDAIRGEEGTDGVELGREDAEDDECERELADGRSHIRPLEGPLLGSDLDESGMGGGQVAALV